MKKLLLILTALSLAVSPAVFAKAHKNQILNQNSNSVVMMESEYVEIWKVAMMQCFILNNVV